jgi:hypothetical protein
LKDILLKIGIQESDEGEIDEEKKVIESENEEHVSLKLNNIKNKRKMLKSSSFETEVIRTKPYDNLTNQLFGILPEWGGKIKMKMNELEINLFIKYNNYKIVDTCTIDYFLLAISFSVIINDKLTPLFIKTSADNSQLILKIEQIIQFVLKNEWDSAKSIWILDVLELIPKRCRFSTFGEEFDFFIKYVKEIQLINYFCKSCNIIFYTNDEIYFEFDENMNLTFSLNEVRNCCFCNCDKNVIKKFHHTPCWLFIQNLIRTNQQKLTAYDLPSEIFFDDHKYLFFMCTYLVGAHFKSIIKIQERFYGFDDLNPTILDDFIPKHNVSSCFYYLS